MAITNQRRFLLLVSGVVYASMASTAVQRQAPPPGVPAHSSTSRPVSPTVVATTMTQTVDGNNSLDLMVLWRGTPEWYFKPGGRRSGGGGGTQGFKYATFQYGGVDLGVELQLQLRVVRIQGKDVPLSVPDANVVLVDGVEGPDLKVVSTHKVDAVTKDRDIVPWLKQSPQVVAFLQCEIPVSNLAKLLVDQICPALMQK